MSEQHRSAKQESPEPSLGMSVGVLCLILFGLFAFVANISVSDIQLAPTALTVEALWGKGAVRLHVGPSLSERHPAEWRYFTLLVPWENSYAWMPRLPRRKDCPLC
jgi:hypothetical protein